MIFLDEWRAYFRIEQIPGCNYRHETINHSQHFVDPVTGTHTQQVESLWAGCKRMMRKEDTMHSRLFETYLPEYMWRKRFDTPFSNAFNILKHIAEQYPLN